MSLEEKVKEVIQGTQKLNRQQRRNMQRKGLKYENKESFTKEELQKGNTAAYEYGKQLALLAATEVIGLGPKRLDRINEVLERLEYQTFVKPFEGDKKP